MLLGRIAMVGCLLLAGGLSGCGDASDSSASKAPPGDTPDAGEVAAKSIMDMQPPSPTKAGKKAAH